MQKELKQFGAKATELLSKAATSSLSGQFHSARVRLTFIYVAILAVILLISSLVISSSFSNRIQRRFRGTPPPGFVALRSPPPGFRNPTNMPTPEQVQADLIQSLIIVNGLLLIGAGLFSYWLAGLTLLPIQAAYQSQSQFLSDASHELRTPLAILKIDLENELSNKSIKKKEQDQAESHLEEVERMSSLVNDLLAISRIDSATGSITATEDNFVEINLVDTVALSVKRLEKYAKTHQVTITTVLPKEKLMLRADFEQIVQAATNLIKNAIDYNKPKGKVTVTLERQENRAVLKVIDTGIGVPKAELTKLFDRFYRVDKSRSRASGGSGLGLAIVKAIAEKYNGSIAMESTPGTETVVTLTLPLS